MVFFVLVEDFAVVLVVLVPLDVLEDLVVLVLEVVFIAVPVTSLFVKFIALIFILSKRACPKASVYFT